MGNSWWAVTKICLRWNFRRHGATVVGASELTRAENGGSFSAFVRQNPQQKFSNSVPSHRPSVPSILMQGVGKAVPGLAMLPTQKPSICFPRRVCGFTLAASGARPVRRRHGGLGRCCAKSQQVTCAGRPQGRPE